MLSIESARKLIIENAPRMPIEQVGLEFLSGRTVGEDIRAAITQPPFNASAMDGYAVHFEDVRTPGAKLKVTGEIAAGSDQSPIIKSGEAVRIFTGGVMPASADHVVIQEHVRREGDDITVVENQSSPRNIRRAGIDFSAGDILARKGETLNDIHASLFAAANLPSVKVSERPRITLFSNGDELVEPCSALAPGQIVNSTRYTLCNLIMRWGADPSYAGCSKDTLDDVRTRMQANQDAHVIVPLGGASVGDYDFVKRAFTDIGGKFEFEKVSIRPGKPVWFGALDDGHVLGLPGNPASALVCAFIFLKPMIDAMLGREPQSALPLRNARLTSPLAKNGMRPSLSRACIALDTDGILHAQPHTKQDSSLLQPFASSNAFIFQDANTPPLNTGETCQILPFEDIGVFDPDLA